MERDGDRLSRDESIVLDYVSGVSPELAEADGPPCEDRAVAEELVALRSQLRAHATRVPAMKTTFRDVLACAKGREDQPGAGRTVSRGNLRALSIAGACLAFLAGVFQGLGPCPETHSPTITSVAFP
ncbi:MAG: hypothetical protein IT463_13210 [Planctomycetes bacterium]|nr:hypothetical protein [Planctomycetota bacterium]